MKLLVFRFFNENNLQVSEKSITFASSKQKRMYKTIEIEMYKDLRDWVEEISYFFGKEVEDSNSDYYEYHFLDDCLLLMEDIYNVGHIHNDLIEALRMACEREIWDRCIYGKPVKIKGTTIIFQK